VNHHRKLLIVVVVTFVITLSGGFLTEYIRQSITYSWEIDVGDEFVYDVLVTGNSTMGSQVVPPPFEPMNNTRIIVEIASLPNLTLMYYAHVFRHEVIDHPKTSSRFDDGSTIPFEFYNAINSHASQSILPAGAWAHLDSLFPDQVNRALPNHREFISRMGSDSFFFGYWSNGTYNKSEWYGIIDLETGVPSVLSFSVWTEGQPWSHNYNVLLTLDN
jgi:hypothetical protein